MDIQSTVSPLDLMLAIAGRLILVNLTLLLIVLTGWACIAVAIESVKDVNKRSTK